MARPKLITVHGTYYRLDGSPETGIVHFRSDVHVLSSGDDSIVVPSYLPVALDVNGHFSVQLPATNDPAWTPINWTYEITLRFKESFKVYRIALPHDIAGSEISMSSLVPAQSPTLGSLYAAYSHVHPQYITVEDLEDADLPFAPIVHTHAASDIVSGVIAAARLPIGITSTTVAAGNHTHAGNSPATTVVSETSYSQSSAVGTASEYARADHTHGTPTLPTAAAIGAAASTHNHAAGDINSGTLNIARLPTGTSGTTVALGNDSRFTDSRTPTSHASTHASAGSDPVTLAQSQVTNLTTDLASKAPTASPTFTGTVSGISKNMVGLGNVDNTSDANKPVSTATQTSLDGKANTTHTHSQSDVTGLTSALAAKANTSSLATVATTGSYNDLLDKPSGGGGGAVSSVAGRTGDVVLTKSDVGLANVDNTSDTSKPVSTATQTALDAKVSGPGSATDNALVRFDSTTGKLVQDSLVTVSDTGTMILTPQASVAYAAGQLFYNSTTESLEFHNNNSNVAMQIGQELWIRVWNATGSTIANGVPVYLSGVNAGSGLPTVALASASAVTTAQVAGLTTEAIANGASGYVTLSGSVSGLNTASFTAGVALYLSATAGTLTATAPTSPNYRVALGTVLVSNSTTGRIMVRPGSPDQGFGTANQVLGMNNAGTAFEHKTFNATNNHITVANAANAITLSLATNTALPGAPTAATATAGTNTTQIATTAFVGTAIGALTKSSVGLANVDNTSDASKPVSTAQQTALDGKPDVYAWNGTAYVLVTTGDIYIGPGDPGSIGNGSIWIDTDA